MLELLGKWQTIGGGVLVAVLVWLTSGPVIALVPPRLAPVLEAAGMVLSAFGIGKAHDNTQKLLTTAQPSAAPLVDKPKL